MSDKLKGLEPERVFHYFEEICRIPHGSGNEKAISDYCVAFAKSHGLWVRQDEALNVVIRKPASPGYESAPVVMIQGHMDMVCEKNSDVTFDFEKDSLNLNIDGDFISASGTTLGGDDGIAVAYALAILEDDRLSHPELEVVITTDEEVGMKGARHLDTSDLKAAYLLNLDNESEGQILTSCAGGMKSRADIPVRRVEWEGIPGSIKISGLKGGHSGAEIHCGRANANRLMGRLLMCLNKELNVGVIKVNGGMKDNAIPRECEAAILIQPEDKERAEQICADFSLDIHDEFHTSDPNIKIELVIESNNIDKVDIFHPSDMERIIFMLVQSPNGIQTMSMELPGLVESSLNLGILTTEEDHVRFSWAVRSSKKSLKYLISDQLEYMTEFLGGHYWYEGEYPHWSFRSESPIRQVVCDAYRELFGKEARVEAIHAGLECGLISEKMPELDMVAIGPDIFDIHTPDEHLSISSVARTYDLIRTVLSRIVK
ncbi:aminoacyl-histidine dipeptidase [Frisingicoccus sp.]|uniref:aminoacyl-histidine dipeptidase n=1 Tax=Frisingicoccus sp. TaxID=1918627 RepID=UPI002A822488|nr:aminoacyl-histidine dipeptidase [Frisingicoccus sp.]MDY4921640.1 aminoacyl-histidine dipeptidase [Frisingicoccus sp.]